MMEERRSENYIQKTPEQEITDLNGCVLPIVKTIASSNWAHRLIWGTYCAFMIVFLSGGIGIVVTKFLSQVTVVNMDQTIIYGKIIMPALTICFPIYEENSLKRILDANPEKLVQNRPFTFEIIAGVSKNFTKVAEWDSLKDGVSPIYNLTSAHFKFNVISKPNIENFSIKVWEQITSQSMQMCTTFELEPTIDLKDKINAKSFSKLIEIEIKPTNLELISSGLMIVHENGFYPFENNGRNMHLNFKIPQNTYVFYMVKKLLMMNTPRSACRKDSGIFKGRQFHYDHALCNANQTCNMQLEDKECDCSWDMLRRLFKPSKSSKSDFLSKRRCLPQAFLVDCKKPCDWTEYDFLHSFDFSSKGWNVTKITLVMNDMIDELKEEELFSLAKLLSEIGGLSSFFFGFSIIVVFEIFEIVLMQLHRLVQRRRENSLSNIKSINEVGFTGVLSLRGRRQGLEQLRCAQEIDERITDSPILGIQKKFTSKKSRIFDTVYEFEGKLIETTIEVISSGRYI